MLQGSQVPTLYSFPLYQDTRGDDAIGLADMAGVKLFPWQKLVLRDSLGVTSTGRWTAPEVGVEVARQSGKGEVIMVRELAGLFLFKEKLIIHSAHETKTSFEAFRRILTVIESVPELDKRVLRVSHSHGQEGIELRSGARLRFMARSTGAGRGFSAPCVILDEAYALTTEQKAAIMPTLSAQANPQLWYLSSAGMVTSIELGKLNARAKKADEGLAYFGWCASPDDDPSHPDTWAKTNPSMGVLINQDTIALEHRSMDAGTFARERLSIGQYPEEAGGWELVPKPVWDDLADPTSEIEGKKAFAIDVTPDRSYACISVAGYRADGKLHGEVTHHAEGTAWLPEVVESLRKKWKPIGIFYDSRGPAASLDLKIDKLTELGAKEVAKACSSWQDECTDLKFRHRDDPRLNTAVAQARKKEYGDGSWFISRKAVEHDLTPLNSVILALYGVQNFKAPSLPMIW